MSKKTTIIISLIIVSLVAGIVYYEMTRTKSLRGIVDSAPYSPTEYQEGVFDCSNMANMMDAWLELHGYKSWILRFSKVDGSSGHAIILVEGQLIEPTTKTFRTITSGTSVTIGNTIFSPPNLADGTYSNLAQIIDSPEQLGIIDMSEWSYPKRW